MTRRDFELIARAIADTRVEQAALPRAGRIANRTLDRAAQRLAADFAVENPRFDRDRFLRACDVLA